MYAMLPDAVTGKLDAFHHNWPLTLASIKKAQLFLIHAIFTSIYTVMPVGSDLGDYFVDYPAQHFYVERTRN